MQNYKTVKRFQMSILCCWSSVQLLSCVQLCNPWPEAHQASLSITNSWSLLISCPSSQWCHLTISSSVVPFSCLQSFPESGSFVVSQFFASGGQSIGISASAPVLPMNIQDWFSLGLTGLILLAVQGTLKRFFQHHSSKASIFWHSASFYFHHQLHTHNFFLNCVFSFICKLTSKSLHQNLICRLNPGSSVVKTLQFQGKGHVFDP